MSTSLSQIRLLALDADGVMTDGGVYYSDELQLLRFDIKDGHGIRALIDSGIVCAVISGRGSRALERRCRELGIDEYHSNVADKVLVCTEIINRLNMDFSQLAYMGDDIPDIPLLKRAGFSAAPADAVLAVREICDWVSTRPGGHGAVRGLADALMSARAS